jgi:dTDP-4-amino-4,6-dideoxygalactose transaminase
MRLRALPPVAAPSTPAELMAGLSGAARPESALATLAGDIGRTLGVRHVFLMSSGRAALTLALRALASTSGRRRVIVPAYTCFSVAASVVKAGLDLVPCDIDPKTLDFDFGELRRLLAESPALCVVSVHLFGLPAETGRTLEMCRPEGTFVVEDAAQAFGFKRGDRWLGTEGNVGFFSFGRGKTVSACGGGAIVTNLPELEAALQREWQTIEGPSSFGALLSLAKAAVVSALVRPQVYWLPAHMPFLGIGETHYSTDFVVGRMSGAQAGLLASWKERSAGMNQARITRLSQLGPVAGALAPKSDVPCLRLPVICSSRNERDRLCEAGRRAGLGIVPMYPSALNGVPALAALLGRNHYPAAEAVAERLLTVPVHPLVSDKEIAAIGRLLCDARAREN